MNKDEILKKLYNLFFGFAIWIIVGIVVLFMYFNFNEELYRQLMLFLLPAGSYCLAILVVIWFRRRKHKRLEEGGSETSSGVYITQWDLMKHDLVMFATPLIMIGITKFVKGDIEGFDIFLSLIALLGIYVSELIYKRKM
jgi:hypothetical protein